MRELRSDEEQGGVLSGRPALSQVHCEGNRKRTIAPCRGASHLDAANVWD